MVRTCSKADCRRAPEPGWARCDRHVREAIANAFRPDRPQGGERHAGGANGPVDPHAVLQAATA